jgi:hypothetical protein
MLFNLNGENRKKRIFYLFFYFINKIFSIFATDFVTKFFAYDIKNKKKSIELFLCCLKIWRLDDCIQNDKLSVHVDGVSLT